MTAFTFPALGAAGARFQTRENLEAEVRRAIGTETAARIAGDDALRDDIDALSSGVRIVGEWSAASGAFPTGTIAAGDAWIVSTGGTVGGVAFAPFDRLIALGTGGATYAGNWLKANYSDVFDQLGDALVVPTGGTVARPLADVVTRDVRTFGTLGTANDTATIQAAWDAGVFAMPPGTYQVDGLDLPNGADLSMLRGVTFRRRNNATAAYVIRGLNRKGPLLTGQFTIDGNAANQTVPADTLLFDGCGAVVVGTGVSLIGGHYYTGTNLGRALYFVNGTDEADDTLTILSPKVSGSANTGILIEDSGAWVIEKATARGARFAQIGVVDPTLPVPTGAGVKNVRCKIVNCDVDGSDTAGNGISFNGFRSGSGTGGANIISPFFPVHSLFVVQGNTVTNCRTYGISAQGFGVILKGNIVTNCGAFGDGGGLSTAAGGVLFNCNLSAADSNIISGCAPYGIDAGVSFGSQVNDNTISVTGITSGTAVALNMGASRNCMAKNNTLRAVNNGAGTAGTTYLILASALDGSGATNYAPWIGDDLTIEGNKGELLHAQARGIRCYGPWVSITVRNNEIRDDVSRRDFAFDMITPHDRVVATGNIVWNTTGRKAISVASGSTITVPEWAEVVEITGTATINRIQTASMNEVGIGGVGTVDATNVGSGYTSLPTVSVSGGGGSGCVLEPALSADGTIAGYQIAAYGTGYTSAPTVSVSGGGGSGATAIATIGLDGTSGRTLQLVFAGAATLTHGATAANNIRLRAGTNFVAAADRAITLIGRGGLWVEA